MTGNCSCAGSSTSTLRKSTWTRSTKVLTSAMNQKNRGEFAWDDVNNCKLDPARVREAPKAKVEYFQKSTYKKVPVQKCKVVTRNVPIKVR